MSKGSDDYHDGSIGVLPIDGGDSSPINTNRYPYKVRVDPHEFGSSAQAYTGQSDVVTWNGVNNVETKLSYSHPARWLGRSHRNIGGKFEHTRMLVTKFGDEMGLEKSGTLWRRWQGVMAPSGFINGLTPSPSSTYENLSNLVVSRVPPASANDLDAAGATAIARIAPTNPLVDLSTSAAELLREGLPQVPGRAGNIGGEYLNVQFGYLPLIGDAKDIASTARQHDALLRQYERDSGRWVRRRYRFEPEITSTHTVQTGVAPYGYGAAINGSLVDLGTRHTTTITETNTWFSGAFTYHLPQSGWRRTVAELDHLYGIRPGIDTLWQLTGYSWLVDYFSNVGDVMSNLTAFHQDGLVMPYGYIMRKQEMTRQETWTGLASVGGVKKELTLTSEVRFITHQRRLANPFGFGLTDGALSGRQKSILIALGISRL